MNATPQPTETDAADFHAWTGKSLAAMSTEDLRDTAESLQDPTFPEHGEAKAKARRAAWAELAHRGAMDPGLVEPA